MIGAELVIRGILLGVGLAADALAVSMTNGFNEPKMPVKRVALIAAFFASGSKRRDPNAPLVTRTGLALRAASQRPARRSFSRLASELPSRGVSRLSSPPCAALKESSAS